MGGTLIKIGIIAAILNLFGCSGQTIQDKGKHAEETQMPKKMDIKAFKENWGIPAIPLELEKLIYFQNNISSAERYSAGFAVTIDDKLGLKSWSQDASFLDRLSPFAQANGTGSFYAIWNDGTTKPMSKMPIVVFGDEGGTHVVAEDIAQLLHLVTFDTEISVDLEKAYFYKDADYEKSEDLYKYLKWLKETFGLDQTQNPSQIISSAQEKYKAQFDKWIEQYYNMP